MRTWALTAVFFLLACGTNTVTTGGTGGSAGGGSATGGGSSTGGGAAAGGGSGAGGGFGCSDAAKVVYVIDVDNTFSSFDPHTLTFTDLGQLNCPANSGATPFSMSVDRNAFAYVLYNDGELFKVDTNGLGCTPTAFNGGSTFHNFGMGFSTDTAGGTTDSLFIAGGAAVGATSQLAHLDVGSFGAAALGMVNGWPELTGTGDAKLWGFFPGVNAATPFVAQLDKTDAHLGTTFDASSIAGDPHDWAFAFWGGKFWIFLRRDTDPSTVVYEMDAMNGNLSTAIGDTGRTIVGAGVSTCAPIDIN